MLLLGTLLLVTIITVALFKLGEREEKKRYRRDDEINYFDACGAIGTIIFLVVFLVLCFSTTIGYYNQIYDLENIKQIDAVTVILKQKADNLTAEFVTYLSEQYPDLEKEIFKSISPDKVGLYLASYPQIKSSETIMGLVDMINKLQKDYYDQRLLKEVTLRDIRVRLRNPCIITAIIPDN
jgi:hypothetical protein